MASVMTGRKMDDEQMLIPDAEEPTVMQQPQTQQLQQQQYGPMPEPPTYSPRQHQGVPMVAMAGGGMQSSTNTTIVINQPPAQAPAGPRIWSSSLCSCCDDMGSCLLGTFCPLVLACRISLDMEESMCVPCCVPGWAVVLRTKLRVENNIQMAREQKFIRMAYRPAG